MSYGSESVRNRHRPGIQVQDTREYSGPVRGGTRHKLSTQSTVLEKARQHKYEMSGGKNRDGLDASEFV